jgi:cytochrome c peroxidase
MSARWPALAAALALAAPIAPTASGAPQDPVAAPESLAGFSAEELRKILTHAPLGEPPPDETNAALAHPLAARLGQRLFFDPRVSRDGDRSCATCHVPEKGFADGLAVGEGLGVLTRNTPSLWNVAYGRWYFWDGRADSLWSQALQPTESELELGGDRAAIAHLIHGDPLLRADYEAVFGPLPELSDRARFPAHARPVPAGPAHPHQRSFDAMAEADRNAIDRVFANYGKALAAYQSRLVSRRSAFDVFAEGLRDGDPAKLAALGAAERRGLALFVGKGRCRMCHAGPNFSDGEFHGTGVAPLGGGTPFDPGRYAGAGLLLADAFNSTGVFSDDAQGPRATQVRTLARGPESWGEFKTPSLRNVALTAPYMHQGQFATLSEVVRFYSTLEGSAPPGHHQEQVLQPLGLGADEQADLVAFLASLTDAGVDASLLGPVVDPLSADAGSAAE